MNINAYWLFGAQKILRDFYKGSVCFINLVLANATNPT